MKTTQESIAVIKLGGSVLTDAAAYARCAAWVGHRLNRERDQRLVVVVSAQAGMTDELEALAREIDAEPDPAALDLMWSTGELRSVATLTLWLGRLGVSAVGLNAHECGLMDRSGARDTTELCVDVLHLHHRLTTHDVVVVPGFLARGPFDAVVTLGRGGSDLSAVLLASALGAAHCELIKDVGGYFSADPKRDATARRLTKLTYDGALQMARAGCEFVQPAALEVGRRNRVRLVIRALDETVGSTVVSDDEGNAARTDVRSTSVAAEKVASGFATTPGLHLAG